MQSGYSHGYQYDFFISYSTRDVDWVQPFYDALRKDLNRWTPHDVFTFWDKEGLKPGDTWDEKLQHASANSAVLVPILTPRFFTSDFCGKELESFTGGSRLSGDAAHRSRIFPVELLCPAPEGHWLAACQAKRFCGKSHTGNPIEFAPGSAEFNEALRDLAVAIAELLPHVPTKASGRAAVYLADNFLEQSKVLRRSLTHKYDVLPAMPEKLLELDAPQLQKHIQESLSSCFVSVHPLDRNPAADYLVRTQLELAHASQKPHLVWTAVQSVELTELTNAGFEWLDSQAGIEERIRVLNAQPVKFKNLGSNPLIYFLCPDRANRDEAEPLLDVLQKQGVCIYPSPLSGSADEAMARHVKALEELDGCLIYYGNTEQDWFDTVFLRLRRHIQERRVRSAIYVGPPPNDFKEHDLKFLGVPLLDRPQAAAAYFAGASA
jgi:TIR domain